MNSNIFGYAKQQNSQQVQYRIDLLIALYNEAIATLGKLKNSLSASDEMANAHHRLQLQHLILGILEGLNENFGESAPNIRAICAFVVEQAIGSDPEGIDSAAQALTIIREGFEGVRDQAVEFEKSDSEEATWLRRRESEFNAIA